MAGLGQRLRGAWREFKGMSSLDIFREIYGGRESKAGVNVGWSQALDVSAVHACVRVLRNGVAQVPFPIMQEVDGRRRKAVDHPVYRVLRRPNAYQTSFTFRETVMTHLTLTGNAFVWKGMVGSSRELRVLEPIDPALVTVTRADDGSLSYKVTAQNGMARIFSAQEIWHIRGASWTPWIGMDAVKLARDAIGLAIATEQSHADFHKNGARVSGLLSMDGAIGKDKFESLSAWLDRHQQGGDRAGKPLILDNKAQWSTFSMSGVDSEHLATRVHQVEEVARAFGLMPIMIGQADKAATYASAEQMFLAHVIHGLSPWYSRLEQSVDADLLTEEDHEAGYYSKFMTNGLMRGAATDRAAFYASALGSGSPGTAWLTTNEVRAFEDLDAIDGGDVLPTGIPPAIGAANGTN